MAFDGIPSIFNCLQYVEIGDIVSKAFFKITTIYHLFVCIKNIKTERKKCVLIKLSKLVQNFL